MKKGIKGGLVALVLTAILSVYPPQEAQARFWGKTTTEREGTAADGSCFTKECTETCRFWICNTSCIDRPGC